MKIKWFLNRLSKMPLPEIPWRVFEKAKKIIDKHKTFDCLDNSCLPEKNIFFLSHRAESATLKSHFPETIKYHLSIADLALENRFNAFGIDVCFEDKSGWRLDPITKKFWPEKFWGDIDYSDNNLGGIKFVWEFNRLYFLFSLGLCYRLTKEKRYADKILWIIQSWLEAAPYPIGVNWASGIEGGVRLSNLAWAISFLKNYSFAATDLRAINRIVWFHANHLLRYPSRYSSANNHLLAEGFGLFIAGLYFPHLHGARRWLARGRQILDAEAGRQIMSDGGSFEFSTTYLSFVFDFFLFYKHMCRTCGLNYSPQVDQRLKSACYFIQSIMDQNGNVPNIGDQDSAVLVGFGLSNKENFSSILNTGAVIFNAPELATGRPDLKTWLITGELNSYPGYTPRLSPFQVFLYEESGLAVIRDRMAGKEVLFVGNAMPLGLAPLYAHGHLDALSFTLSVDGMEIFVDPGTYLYQRGGKWRQYFRSTAAHNTIRLNKMDLSKQPGDFMFGRPYRVTTNHMEHDIGRVVWMAEHDAYLKKSPFAVVSREVIYDKNSKEFVITDYIKTEERVFVEIFFHCHPECIINKVEDGFNISRGNAGLHLFADLFLDTKMLCGSHEPLSGWYSPTFNEISECTTILCYGILECGGRIKSRISIKPNG